VCEDPAGFKKLISFVSDRDRFTIQARKMGFTEPIFAARGGGEWELLVLLGAAFLMAGCTPKPTPPAPARCIVTITMTNATPPTGGPGSGTYTLDLDFTSASSLAGHKVGWPSVGFPLFAGKGGFNGQWGRLESLWNQGAIPVATKGVTETFGNPEQALRFFEKKASVE